MKSLALGTRAVNTDRLRIKKLSPKFWKEVHQHEIQILGLNSCEGVSESLEEIQKLEHLYLLMFCWVEVDSRIKNLKLPENRIELELKEFNCTALDEFPDLPQVVSLEYRERNQDFFDGKTICSHLKNLEHGDFDLWGDESIEAAIETLSTLKKLKTLNVGMGGASESKLVDFLGFIKKAGITCTLDYHYAGDKEEEDSNLKTLISDSGAACKLAYDENDLEV